MTGATGFVGTALVARLAALGTEVHALARPGSDRSALAALPVVWHVGDLSDGAALERAVAAAAESAERSGAAARVVHSAALISYRTRDAEEARRVNVEGTRLVLEACRARGAGRICVVSSIVAVGHAADARSSLDEDAPFNGAELRAHYVTTKRAEEDLALAAVPESDVVVVEPGAIFGPSPRPTNTARFLRRLAARTLGPLAPPGSLGVVGVEDVAEGIRLALERGARGRRYLLVESSWTLAELYALAAGELGVPPPRGTVPPALWRLLVAGAALVDRFRPLELMTPQSMRLLGAHLRYDARRARAELGWSPAPFREVLARTIAWMHAEGEL